MARNAATLRMNPLPSQNIDDSIKDRIQNPELQMRGAIGSGTQQNITSGRTLEFIHLSDGIRPEEPAINTPDRKVGIRLLDDLLSQQKKIAPMRSFFVQSSCLREVSLKSENAQTAFVL
jgi:hypothetical protein